MMPRLWLWLACAAAIVIQYMSHPRAFIINICLDMMTMAGLPQTRQAVPPGARLRHAAAPAQQRAHHAPARRAWPRPSLRPNTRKFKKAKKANKKKPEGKEQALRKPKTNTTKKPEGKEQAHRRQFFHFLR